MTVDGKKTSSKKGKALPLPKKGKEATEEEVSSDEASEDEADPTYEESSEADDSQSDGGSDVETDQSEDEVDAEDQLTASEAMKKSKAKLVKKPKETKKTPSKKKASKRKAENETKPSKKQKTEVEEKKDEKTFDPVQADAATSVADDSSSKAGKPTKKEMAQFSDKNVDYDLFHNSATNVIPRRIKISNNLIVTCRMVEQFESKNITNDYPAITFQRKTAGEKCFEFILPLNLSPKIVDAVNLIIKDNARFFTNSQNP